LGSLCLACHHRLWESHDIIVVRPYPALPYPALLAALPASSGSPHVHGCDEVREGIRPDGTPYSASSPILNVVNSNLWFELGTHSRGILS
jgi:hypothetical protein